MTQFHVTIEYTETITKRAIYTVEAATREAAEAAARDHDANEDPAFQEVGFDCDHATFTVQSAMAAAMRIGTRVRLIRDVDLFPFMIARAGATGTVTERDTYIAVRLDEYDDNLDEWGNCLQVFDADQDEYPCTVADFELIAP